MLIVVRFKKITRSTSHESYRSHNAAIAAAAKHRPKCTRRHHHISSTRSPYFTIEHPNERKFNYLLGTIEIAKYPLYPLTILTLSCVSTLPTYLVIFYHLLEFTDTFILFLILRHDTAVLAFQS